MQQAGFQRYVAERLEGFEARMPPGGLPVPTGPIGIDGRDALMFPDFYRMCSRTIRSRTRFAWRRASASARSAMSATKNFNATSAISKPRWRQQRPMKGFMPSISPTLSAKNEYYKSDAEFLDRLWRSDARGIPSDHRSRIAFCRSTFRLLSAWDAASNNELADYRK